MPDESGAGQRGVADSGGRSGSLDPRAHYIKELEAGRNPFNAQELEQLRGE